MVQRQAKTGRSRNREADAETDGEEGRDICLQEGREGCSHMRVTFCVHPSSAARRVEGQRVLEQDPFKHHDV